MAEQTHNTDMSDEPDRQDLEDRVDQLESTISKMLPGRRDALKLGGAALVGGAAMSGTASAGGESEGTIGTPGALIDIESEDINNADTITTKDLLVDGKGVLTAATNTGDPGLSLGGGFKVVDADNPTLVNLQIFAQTDGNSNAIVNVNVDNSGGSTKDYRAFRAFADPNMGADVRLDEGGMVYLPSGASIEIENQDDPVGNNKIRNQQKITL